MLIDDEFGDLGQPTELESWKHQSQMLCDQIADVQRRLDRSRRHVSKLVDMHAEVSRERDALRSQLAAANTRISDCLRSSAEDWATIDSLKRVSIQADELRYECLELRGKLSSKLTIPHA
jgi:chromosome segregation ATPase